jgi:starch synthase
MLRIAPLGQPVHAAHVAPLIADAYDAKTALPRPLRVLMVCAELAPFARSGGLGDVMQGLSSALGTMGVEVAVATPLYAVTNLDSAAGPYCWSRPLWVPLGGDVRQVGVHETVAAGDVRVLLLDCPPLFRRDGIYGDRSGSFADNDLRFALLSAAALRAAQVLWEGPPDILHAHDWHAGLGVAFARLSDDPDLREMPSVFTFHNLAFQGLFPLERAPVLGLTEAVLHDDAVRSGDHINFMQAGLVYADRVTTVSPSYAKQAIQPAHGCGLDSVLRARSNSLVGITNGIDTATWGPSRDRALTARYDAHDPSGRAACRLALAAELGLDVRNNTPIVGVVSRLTHQKGVDLLLEPLGDLVAAGLRFAIVAFGSAELERQLSLAAAAHPGRVAFRAVFGDPIARRVYAGADIFLMPSRFEPCGLGQQYAMRYGAVPVASTVGGLADTIEQVDEEAATGTGFLFSDITANGLAGALRQAACAHQSPSLWSRIIRNCMMRDASWDASARLYFAMYRDLAGALPRPSLPPPAPVTGAS